MLARVRHNPRLAVAIGVAVLLVLAWIGWTIYVASDQGATEGLGVLIAWPALIAAAALVSLPFIGAFLLIRRRQMERSSRAVIDDSEVSRNDGSPSADSTDSKEAEATSAG
jgi:hypothetical protein